MRTAALLVLAWAVWAGGADAPPRGPITVLLLRFEAIGDAAQAGWVGRAIQQNLANDLERSNLASPRLPVAEPPVAADATAARRLAREAQTVLVAYGAYQINDGEIRITSQLLDVASGQVLGAMKATGSLRDLFAVEDSLSEQTRKVLRQITNRPVEPPAPVIPQAIAEIANVGGLIQPAGPIRDDFWQARDDLELAMLRARLDREYDASYYRYNLGFLPTWYGAWPCYPHYTYGYGHGWRGYSRRGGLTISGAYYFPNGYLRFSR
jgi:TolB-like protein